MVMSITELLNQARQQMSMVDGQIAEARKAITLLEQAGEDTADLRARLSALAIRRQRWQMMLDNNQ